MIKIKCKNCNKTFESCKSNNRKFCSRKCMYEGRNKKKLNQKAYVCKNCKKVFYDFPSMKRVTCSLFCKNKIHNPIINEKHHKFPKGYVPPNKGVKGWTHKKSFKIGHIPWNKNKKGYSTNLKGRKRPKSFGEKISNATKGKPRYDKRGKNSHFWKGGVSKLSDRIRRTNKYKEWRKHVFERDNYTCQECKKRGSYLEAHHIKQFSKILEDNDITTLDKAYECKELWNIDNGQTLCLDCHKRNGRPNKIISKNSIKTLLVR